MGWFDEQIRQRRQRDEEVFRAAFSEIGDAVMGRQLFFAMRETHAENAVTEILRWFRLKTDKTEIPAGLRTDRERLEMILRPYGILYRSAMLEKTWYVHNVGPMLGTLKEDGRAVALLPGRFSGYRMVDDETRKMIPVTPAVAARLNPEVLCFYRPLPLRALTAKDLRQYLRACLNPSDSVLILAAMLSRLLLNGLALWQLWTLLMYVRQGMKLPMFVMPLLFITCTAVSACLTEFVKNRALGSAAARMRNQLTVAVMCRTVRMPVSFYRQFSAGELTACVMNLAGLGDLRAETAGDLLSLCCSLICLCGISLLEPRLIWPILAMIGCSVLLALLTGRTEKQRMREQLELMTENNGERYAMLTGIRKLRLAGAEKRIFSRMTVQEARRASLRYNPPAILRYSTVFSEIILAGGMLLALSVAFAEQMQPENFCIFLALFCMIVTPLGRLVPAVRKWVTGTAILQESAPLMETAPEINPVQDPVNRLTGNIEINNLSFRYAENMPLIIDDLTLKIHPGDYVALVGRTACGKSTLVRVLLGFEVPTRGAVYYDGRDLKRLDLKSLRQHIGVVLQQEELLPGTVYTNIALNTPGLSREDAWQAAELAGIAGDLRQMPMGLDTVVIGGASGFSGGQRQRIILARALAGKPKLLILDEATSALDNVTQKQVCDALDSLHCTRIVVAHRLSTVRQCSRILVLDQGKIIEEGTYEELMARNGLFAELAVRQLA